MNHAFEPVDAESEQALEVDDAAGVCRTRSSKPVERKAKVLQFVGRGQRTTGWLDWKHSKDEIVQQDSGFSR